MSDPRYWKAARDLNVLDGLDDFNDSDTVAHITDEPWADPLDKGDTNEYWGQDVAAATDAERADWAAHWDTLSRAAARAHDDLAAARAAWDNAQGVHAARLRDAWDAYQPTHEAIERRVEEVNRLREDARLAELARQEQAAVDAQADEDRRLGPRTWITFHPSSMDRKVAPDMMVPIIHLNPCKVTGGGEDRSYPSEYRYARKDEVQEVLLAGGPEMSRGSATGYRLHTKLCGRCKPEASLREALGETFDKWLVEAESVQPPMPTRKGMPKALGLEDEWVALYPRRDGYDVSSSSYYGAAPHEALIGWAVTRPEGGAQFTDDAEEHLARLVEVLPARGFAVRRLEVPARLNRQRAGEVSSAYVAVRRLTKHEIRQANADAAATARYQAGQG